MNSRLRNPLRVTFMIRIEPVIETHWSLLKSVRLQALADSPEAFSTTLAQARALPDEEWQERACRFGAGLRQAAHIAYANETPYGMVTCYLLASAHPDAAEINAMWVDPVFRRHGIGRSLVDAAVSWSARLGLMTVTAWVAEQNDQSVAFYERIGFIRCDQHPRFLSDPTRNDRLMIRRIMPTK